MGDDEKRKAFLKGFEEGLKSAWREIGALTTRGYSSTELMVMAKSKMAVLYRDVERMEARILEEEGISVVGGARCRRGGTSAVVARTSCASRRRIESSSC